MRHQMAYNINLALEQLGVIDIVDRGDPTPANGRATQFRYLLPSTENGADESDEQHVEI